MIKSEQKLRFIFYKMSFNIIYAVFVILILHIATLLWSFYLSVKKFRYSQHILHVILVKSKNIGLHNSC